MEVTMDNEMSYLFGLFQTDGHLSEDTRNRGKFSLEIDIKDEDIIKKLNKIITVNSSISYRKRITNFGPSSSVKISVYDYRFREQLKSWGFPVGKKSGIIRPPSTEYSEIDYIRGLIDGDGSIGITSSGFPIFGFVTTSEEMKNYIINFIYKVTGKNKQINRNQRDNCFNICLYKEDVIKLVSILYYDGCLSIKRKFDSAQKVKKWNRPTNMIKVNQQKWNKSQDDFILNNSINESILSLNRTEKSVKMRLWKLKNKASE